MGIIPLQQGVMHIWGLRKQEGIQAVTTLLSKSNKKNPKPTHNKQQKDPQINQQPADFSNAFGTVMCHSADLPGKITC